MNMQDRLGEWQPILRDEDRCAAHDALRAIIGELDRVDLSSASPISLSEYALLFAYLAMVEDGSGQEERVAGYLNAAIEKVSAADGSRVLSTALFGGLPEIAWCIGHVSQLWNNQTREPDSTDELSDEDPASEIDSLLIECLRNDIGIAQYDLVSGLVGLGVYFLSRFPRRCAAVGLDLVLEHLEQRADKAPPGVTWFTKSDLLPPSQQAQCPFGYYNLGVAHGIPGVIHFLGELISVASYKGRAWPLLEGAVKWTLAQERPPGSTYRFSSWTIPGVEPADSRLGWCYGDLGVGTVLARCSFRLGREDWREASTRILNHCLEIPDHSTNVRDAGLCHGAIGIAHIMNRLYHLTGEGRYRAEATRWFRQGLSMRIPGHGAGGFLMYVPDAIPPWAADYSFLGGGVGIALALLSALHPVVPRWDSLLLLSSAQACGPVESKHQPHHQIA